MYRRVLKPGMHVSAKYHQDGEMYDAEVVHVATNNVLVKFLEYDVQVLNVGLSLMRCILQLYGVLSDDGTVLITRASVPLSRKKSLLTTSGCQMDLKSKTPKSLTIFKLYRCMLLHFDRAATLGNSLGWSIRMPRATMCRPRMMERHLTQPHHRHRLLPLRTHLGQNRIIRC